jgi:hypothetical protein
MRRSIETFLGTLSVAVLVAVPTARAQGNPESGEVMQGAEMQGGAQFGAQVEGGAQPEGSWQPPTGQIPPQGPEMGPAPGDPYVDPSLAPPPGDPMAPPGAPVGDSDHAAVVGKFGVGFFGVLTVPIMGCDPLQALCAPIGNGSVSAPTIGMRYWLSDTVGIDAALGLNVTSGEAGPLATSAFAVVVHGGVPLALAHTGHLVFEVVPQINFGIASGSYEIIGTIADVSGLLIEAGAKAGAEIHFGFIGIPQLSLLGSLGILVRHESRSSETMVGTAVPVLGEQSQTNFGTGVDGETWDFLTGSLAAVYYF